MSASDLRAQWADKLSTALIEGEMATLKAWREIEDEILYGMMHKYELTDEQAREIIDKIRERAGGQFDSLKTKGYFLNGDEQVVFGEKIDTMAQLVDHEYTLPLNQIEQGFKAHEDWIRKVAAGGGNLSRSVFDVVGAVWRTDMLLKPGYTFRNSIMEPAVSLAIAQMDTLLTPTGLADAGRGAVNLVKNTGRRARRVTVGSKDKVKAITLQKRYNDLALDYYRLEKQRNKLIAEVRQYEDGGPPSVEMKRIEAQEAADRAEALMGLIQQDLQAAGVTIQPSTPSLTALNRDIRDYESIAKDPLGSSAVERAAWV